MISKTLRRWTTMLLIWALSVPLSLWSDIQEHRRFFRLYPKRALPVRLANAGTLTFAMLCLACWGVVMILIALGIVYDALTGNLQWGLYGRMAFGLTFGFAVWVGVCGALSWVLGRIEKKMTSGVWVPPKG